MVRRRLGVSVRVFLNDGLSGQPERSRRRFPRGWLSRTGEARGKVSFCPFPSRTSSPARGLWPDRVHTNTLDPTRLSKEVNRTQGCRDREPDSRHLRVRAERGDDISVLVSPSEKQGRGQCSPLRTHMDTKGVTRARGSGWHLEPIAPSDTITHPQTPLGEVQKKNGPRGSSRPRLGGQSPQTSGKGRPNRNEQLKLERK